METTNLRIAYNHKRKYEYTNVPKENNVSTPINNLQKWFTTFYSELKIWGVAAGTAIRN